MICPYKFSHYEFEGGQECIGSECGMFKRCNAETEITAVEFDALDAHAQALERENEELRKLCGANDALAAENDVREVRMDANDGDADTRVELEAAAQTAAGYIYGRGFTNGLADAWNDDEVDTAANRIIQLIDRQAAITERECFERGVFDLGAQKQIIEQGRTIVEYADKNAELQAQVDELATENAKLSSDELYLRQALASAEYDNATLREKLGRMLDNAHEITRIGGDC